MATLRTVIAVVQQGNWLALVDLWDAYLHVPVVRALWMYLGFSLSGRRFPAEGAPMRSPPCPVCVHSHGVHSSGLAQVFKDMAIRVPERPPLRGDSSRGSHSSALGLSGPHALMVVVFPKSNLNPSQDLFYQGALLPIEGLTLLPVGRMRLSPEFSCRSTRGRLSPNAPVDANLVTCWQQRFLHVRCQTPDAPVLVAFLGRGTSGVFRSALLGTSEVMAASQWRSSPLDLTLGLPLSRKEGWGDRCLIQGKTLLFSGLWSPLKRATCHLNLLAFL